MRPANTPAENTPLAAWLKSQTDFFSKNLRLIVALAAQRFIVQLIGLYLLAFILAGLLIDDRRPTAVQFVFLSAVFAAQLLLQWQEAEEKLTLSKTVLQHFQEGLMQALQHKSLATVRDHSIAAWQSFFIKRLPALQAYYSEYLPQQRLAALVPLAVLAVALTLNWPVAILLALVAPLIPLFMYLVGKGAAAAHREHFRLLERLGGVFLDRLQARQLLHVHRAVARQKAIFMEAADVVKNRTLAVLRLAFLSASVLDFFATVGVALVAVYVGFSLLGEIHIGKVSARLTFQSGLFVLFLAPLFFAELKTLGRLYHLRAEAVGAAEAIHRVLIADAPACRAEELQLRDLQVLSEQGEILLRAAELTLSHGDKILLQGPSGAGKTALLEALAGMRRMSAREGEHALDTNQLAWLNQDPVVLCGSVRHNLCLGKPFSDARLRQVLSQVELEPWVRQLPRGLDTRLGDYPPLSGGQKQRLAIARLLLFDKAIVFLDEPTAHLGTDQARRISAMLRRVLSDKTLIWVEHDLVCDDFFQQRWLLDADTGQLQLVGVNKLCA